MLLKAKAALAAALLLVIGAEAQGNCPRGIQVRREFRMLSHTERINYYSAVRQLQSQPRPNKYDRYVDDHVQAAVSAHGFPRFLSWHRAFLRALEKDLQAINPSVTVPFWDWAYDSQAPETSILFTNAYLGGNGDPSRNQCVTNGYFAQWQPRNGANCLQRKFSGGTRILALWSWEALQGYALNKPTYDSFRIALEGPHGNVHNGIGAQFSSMRSPDDPTFWHHHSFVDHLWDIWQRQSPANFYNYGGTNHDGTPARATDQLGYGFRVQDVFETRNLCYTYERYRGGQSIPQPPATTPPPRVVATSTSAAASKPTLTAPPPPKSTTIVPPSTNGTIPTGGTKVDVTVPGVVVEPAKNKTNYLPKDDDRSNIINLRPPPPLPEAWCRLNNLKVEDVRKGEAAAYKTLEQINHLPGYVSPSALVNHPDVLGKLAQAGQKFIGYIGDKKIDIPYDVASPANVAKIVQTKVAAVCAQVFKQVGFVYPKVLQNIFKAVDVYQGGKAAAPLLSGAKDVYDDGDEDCEEDEDEYAPAPAPAGNATYGGEIPAGNTTYGTPAPAPAGNATYGAPAPYTPAPAPAGNATYGAPAPYVPAPAPAGNATYGAPAPYVPAPAPAGNATYGGEIPSNPTKPCNKTGGQIPAGNSTYGAPAPAGNDTYGGAKPVAPVPVPAPATPSTKQPAYGY